MPLMKGKTMLMIVLVLIIIATILYILFCCGSSNSTIRSLDSFMTSNITCPKLEPGGVVRVYVSAGMFDIADTLYAIGPDGMKPGLDYQSINLVDMICNFDDSQWAELKDLCTIWDVPWYGISGEIEKMGWQCYCPVRDGLTMATVFAAIAKATYDQVVQPYDASEAGVRPFSQSLFREDALRASVQSTMNIANPTKEDMIAHARQLMNSALGINVGANDLYNMYGTCNACIMNFNGIQADSGALAEIGQLGARGVPCVIIKGSLSGTFGGVANPMPVMATTSGYNLIPNLTDNPGSVFSWTKNGALPWLKKKVDRFIEAEANNNPDPLTNGNYNHYVPLPPLQIFWTDLGSRSYFMKHRSKTIVTLPNGKTDFKKDYTKFWYDNVVAGGTVGLIQVAKAMADNLDQLLKEPKYKNIHEYWL